MANTNSRNTLHMLKDQNRNIGKPMDFTKKSFDANIERIVVGVLEHAY